MVDEETPDNELNDEPEAPEALSPTQPASPTLASVAAGANQPMAPGTSPAAQPQPLNQTVKEYLQSQQAKIAQAQQQASQNEKYSGLARAGATLAAGLAGSNQAVNQQPFDALDQEAKAPVTNLMEKQKAAAGDIAIKTKLDEEKASTDASDPDSDVSKQFRAQYKALFPKDAAAFGDDFDNVTAADAKDIKDLSKVKESIASREQIAGMRRDQAKYQDDAKRQTAADKKELATNAMNEKDAADLGNLLDKGSAARSGAVGMLQQKINNAEATEALIEQAKKQEGGMDSRQVEDLAQSTARTLGGGAAASARVDALVPKSFWGNAQSAGEWLTNKPRGADMQSFTDRMAETVAREKAVAQNQLRKYQIESLSGRQRLQANDPDRYNRMLAARHITPDMIDANGAYQAPAAPPPQGSDQGGDPHARAAAKLAQRQSARAQSAGPAPQPVPTPSPDGMAYGGAVGGLPASNYAASQAMRPPKPPHLNLHAPRGYSDGGDIKKPDNSTWVKNSNDSYRGADPKHDAKVYTGYTQGGSIPGHAPVHGDSPRNDNVPIMASPGEYVVPRHIMQGPAGNFIRKLCEGGQV